MCKSRLKRSNLFSVANRSCVNVLFLLRRTRVFRVTSTRVTFEEGGHHHSSRVRSVPIRNKTCVTDCAKCLCVRAGGPKLRSAGSALHTHGRRVGLALERCGRVAGDVCRARQVCLSSTRGEFELMTVSDLLSLRRSHINDCTAEHIVREGSRATPVQR